MNRFIAKSLRSIFTFLKESLYAEEYAGLPGFLQGLEARLKVAGFAFFLLAVILARAPQMLWLLYALCLIMVLASRIPLLFFLKRTLTFIPFFSLLISLPLIFNPGEPLCKFFLPGKDFIVTRQGVQQAIFFVSRVTVSVSWAVLLTLTTPHAGLLKSLRFFKIPKVFVMILGMTYRYIFLFLGVIENAYLGIRSRIGDGVRVRQGQQIISWNIAALWQRSRELNEKVYDAMLSRGFDGEPVTLEDAKPAAADFIFLACAAAAACLAWKIRFLS